MAPPRFQIPDSFNPDPFYFVHRMVRNEHWILDDNIPYYSFCAILEGEAEYILNGKPYTVMAGDIVFCPPHTVRKAKTKGLRLSDIDFHGDRIEGFDEPLIIRKRSFEKINIYMEYINYLYLSGADNNMAAIRGYVLIILSEVFSGLSSDISAYTVKMREYLIENYMHGVTMDQLAGLTHITPAYCGTLFKRDMGCTVMEYINRLRIDTAIRYMLEDNTMTLGEIAVNIGYSDVYQFSKMFKRIVGESPNAYRKKNSLPMDPGQS